MSADIRQQIHERIDNTDIYTADKPLLELLIGVTAENIMSRNANGLWVLTLIYGIAGTCYKLGLTAKRDTTVEAGTKLLEDLDAK